jgi:hypothetical protein
MTKLSALAPLNILEWVGKKMLQAATLVAAVCSAAQPLAPQAFTPKAGRATPAEAAQATKAPSDPHSSGL